MVEKISQSEQLRSVSDPEILILFEDWLEELENEAIVLMRRQGNLNHKDLSRLLGISEAGSLFLISKLKNQGKI
jgi:DNA-binding transcriptional regulator YiaG